jgi:hypothetical protein
LIKQNIPLPSVQSAAQDVINSIGQEGTGLLLHERHMSGVYWGNGKFWDLDQAHGISIYFPMGKEDWMLSYYVDSELSFAADTAWNEFVADLIRSIQPPPPPPAPPIDPNTRPGPLPLPSVVYLPYITRSK